MEANVQIRPSTGVITECSDCWETIARCCVINGIQTMSDAVWLTTVAAPEGVSHQPPRLLLLQYSLAILCQVQNQVNIETSWFIEDILIYTHNGGHLLFIVHANNVV